MTAVFLLCTIILFVLQTLSMKLQHAEHLPQKLLVNCAFSLLAAAAMGAGRLAVPDMFTVSPATLRHGIAFGVLFALTILFYNLAIASGPLSYTTFYFSASMLVPAFAGVLLFGEALTFTLAAAVALFLAAFWCLNVAPGGAQKPEPRWLTLCALTFLCNGLCAVVQKSQQNATGGAEAAGLMLVGFCTAAACYALAYLALRGRLPAGAADGAGNVKNCLTDNAELLEIDKTKVTDEFAESIIGKKFDAISKIGIDSFVPDEKPIQGGGSKGSPSKGGGSNSGISGITPQAAEPIDKSSKEFTDLDGFEWAQNAINTLRTEGILNGRSEGIFAPSELVLREEFLKMLLSAVTFEELEGTFDFDDVKSDDWYYDTVKKAYLCKIVNGMSDRMFGSGNAVSRQDMAVMCYNALIKKGVITGGDAQNAFADADDIAPYAKEAVSYLNSIKIVNGDENGRFNPNGTATRAESAQMIYNIIEFMKNK